MTNEKLYTLAVEAIRELAESAELADEIINSPRSYKHQRRSESAAQLLLALQEKLDCAGGKSHVVTAAKRIIKEFGRGGGHEPCGWIDTNERFCVCSGYHAARLAYDLPSLPHGKQAIDLDKAVRRPQTLTPVDLPSIGEIRAHIAANRGKKPAAPFILNIDGFEWGCNAQYLLDMLQILPDCTAYTPDGPLAPMWFSAPDGSDGTLLPVRLRNRPTQAAD